MGGCLSVRYTQAWWQEKYEEDLPLPAIKVGTDEVNFKMYAMQKKAWSMNKMKKIMPKNEGTW